MLTPVLHSTRAFWKVRGLLPLFLQLMLTVLLLWASLPARAWELSGDKRVRLHGRDGQVLEIATLRFEPRPDGRTTFTLKMDHDRLKDYFLSMREFKCVDGQGEVMCHVPYPYPQPGTVKSGDYAWLEHSLLFMFKRPSDFGAKLWNGVYFQLSAGANGLEGRPQAVDLNLIGAPPDKPDQPPYRPVLRDDIAPGTRWFERLTIE